FIGAIVVQNLGGIKALLIGAFILLGCALISITLQQILQKKAQQEKAALKISVNQGE
ncbi:MFS transporter, partial [Listeria monocytogenes]|nr:MFS transporter [Listeria monocytogenes]